MKQKKGRIPYEREVLLEEIYCDIINGLPRLQVKRKLDEDAYSIQTSQYCRSNKYKIIDDAYKLCEIEIKENKDRLRKLFYERTLSLYADCVDQNDRRTALDAIKYLSKLSGVESSDNNININSDGNVTISFGFENKNEDNQEDE